MGYKYVSHFKFFSEFKCQAIKPNKPLKSCPLMCSIFIWFKSDVSSLFFVVGCTPIPPFLLLGLSLYGSPESLKEIQIDLHQIKLLCIKQSYSASNEVSCVRVSASSKVLLHQVKFRCIK